jgi:hypothetical protein
MKQLGCDEAWHGTTAAYRISTYRIIDGKIQGQITIF